MHGLTANPPVNGCLWVPTCLLWRRSKVCSIDEREGRGSKRTSESANWIISEGQKERGPSTQVDLLPPCSKTQTVRVCEWFGHVQFEFSTFVLFIFPVQCLPSYPALPKTLARFCGFVQFCCPSKPKIVFSGWASVPSTSSSTPNPLQSPWKNVIKCLGWATAVTTSGNKVTRAVLKSLAFTWLGKVQQTGTPHVFIGCEKVAGIPLLLLNQGYVGWIELSMLWKCHPILFTCLAIQWPAPNGVVPSEANPLKLKSVPVGRTPLPLLLAVPPKLELGSI